MQTFKQEKRCSWWGPETLNTRDLDDTASATTEWNKSQKVTSEIYFLSSSSKMSAIWLQWQWQLL